MIGDDGGPLRHHQGQVRLHNCFAVERAVLPEATLPCAEAIFTSDEEWKVLLELAFVCGQKSDHTAEMIVVAVAQHQRIEIPGIYFENRHVVDERFRRVTKIDQNVAYLVAALRFRMHRESPLAVQRGARWRIRCQIGTRAALDGKAIALFRGNELYDLIVRDDANGNPVNLRNPRPERLSSRRPRASGQRADKSRHKACAAGAEQPTSRYWPPW